jgi:hypothetical protein
MTVSHLAKITGLNKETIRKYMRGESEPSVYIAILISDALFCNIQSLWSAEVYETKDLQSYDD